MIGYTAMIIDCKISEKVLRLPVDYVGSSVGSVESVISKVGYLPYLVSPSTIALYPCKLQRR